MATSEKRTLSLYARLVDQLSKPLKGIELAVHRFGQASLKGFKLATSAVFNLKTAVVGLVSAYGGLVAIGQIREFADQADQLLKLAAATGDTVENLSELQAAFELTGVKGGEFDNILRALLTNSRKAIDGNDELAESFAEIGVTIEDLQQLAPAQLFEKISAGLERFASAQERQQTLSRLLPRSFLPAFALLGQGLQKFQDQIREAREAGATIGESQARVAERLGDAFTKIQFSLRGVALAIVEAFGPTAIAGLERLAKLITENKDLLVEVGAVIGKTIVSSVRLAVDAIIGLVAAIDSLPFVTLIDEKKTQQSIGRLRQDLRTIDEAMTGSATRELAKLQDQLQRAQSGSKGRRENLQNLITDTELVLARAGAEGSRLREKILNELVPRKAEIEKSVREFEADLSDGLAGRLKRMSAALEKQLRDATRQVTADTRAPINALGLPTIDEVTDYAKKVGSVIASVFAKPTGKPSQVLGESEDKLLSRERERLQIIQRIGQLGGDLEPVRQALREIDRQSILLDLQKALKDTTITAAEFAQATAFVNAQFERTRELVSTDFFGGFQKGLEESLKSWTDFAAAGREAAVTLIDGGLNGLTDAFASIIDGTKSAKEAFKDFARQMLSDLARMIAKLLVMQGLKLFLGFEDGGVLPNVEAFAGGGIARGPTFAMFGEGRTAEAFVPLPDNRSIPVTLNGGVGAGGNVFQFFIQAFDSKDVARHLFEQQSTLRTIWTNQVETRNGMRQVIRRAVA